MNNFYRHLSLWVVIGLVVILLYNLFSVRPQMVTELVYSEFLSRVEAGEVAEVLLRGRDISGKFVEGGQFSTYSAEDPDLVSYLRERNVRIVAQPVQDNPWYVTIFVSWFPMLLLIAVCILAVSKGADWMIDGVVELARRTGLPRIVIGATIISLGTTTPEAFVSVMAAWMGNPGLALGNGVGSIICDTGMIFGLTCLLSRVPVNAYILNPMCGKSACSGQSNISHSHNANFVELHQDAS